MLKQLGVMGLCSSALLLSACVHHLTLQECQTMNWQQMGYTDGTQGKAPRNLQQYIQDCMKFHIAIDTSLYTKGWHNGARVYCHPSASLGEDQGRAGVALDHIQAQRGVFCQSAGSALNLNQFKRGYDKGIRQYCTYHNGYNIALTGHQPADVCHGSLHKAFIDGWNAGGKKFCGNTANAFAMGKAGKAYPAMCDPAIYMAFKNEFDRGHAVRSRVGSLQRQIDGINQNIRDLVYDHKLVQADDDTYLLGNDRSPAARDALQRVRILVRERRRLKTQLFDAQTKR